MFKVGESAVYPAHGIAVVKRIDEREIGGKKKTFYVLQILERNLTLMVPTDNAEAVGLRSIISDTEVPKVYSILKMRDVKIDQTTWNRRYRDYMEKIKTGSIYEISQVLRDLFLLRHSKDLSFKSPSSSKRSRRSSCPDHSGLEHVKRIIPEFVGLLGDVFHELVFVTAHRFEVSADPAVGF